MQNLRGCGHNMLCFPVKSEIAQNFRVHSVGLVAVICRKVVLCVLSFRGMTSDERGVEEKRHPRLGSKKRKKNKKTIKHNKKNVFFWFLFCYEHNFKCLPFFSLDCLSIPLFLFIFFCPLFLPSLCSVLFFCFLVLGFLLLASFLCFSLFLPRFFAFPS